MDRPSAAVHLLSNALSRALLWAKEPRAPRPPWGRSSFLCSSPCHGVLHPDLSLTPPLITSLQGMRRIGSFPQGPPQCDNKMKLNAQNCLLPKLQCDQKGPALPQAQLTPPHSNPQTCPPVWGFPWVTVGAGRESDLVLTRASTALCVSRAWSFPSSLQWAQGRDNHWGRSALH